MNLFWTILEITAYLAVYTLFYELLRYRIKRSFARRFRKSVRQFLNKHEINVERNRFIAKQLVRMELLDDPKIQEAMLLHAQEKNLPLESVIEEVEEYIDEIVPAFNLLSYYKIAYTVAKVSLNLAYNIVIDQEHLKQLDQLPKDVVQVYIMNHRSNADFVLAGFMLSRSICISFAVGEWARVWPLETLFKSFGSYFVRRGYRVPLYHKVLERYLAFITKKGLNQGIFIEGGLSRDGKLRPPKIGLLDYIIRASQEKDFSYKDVLFIPVGINFDWVLEDRNLLAEKKGKKRRGFFWKMASLCRFIVFFPPILILNFFRFVMGRMKKFGYASVAFGKPLSLKEYLEKDDFRKLEGEARKEPLKRFGQYLLEEIGKVIPITPVCITAKAFLDFESSSVEKKALVQKIKKLRHHYRDKGHPLVMGEEFQWYQEQKAGLQEAKEYRREELFMVEEELVEDEGAEKTLQLAMDILGSRKILYLKKGMIHLNPKEKEVLEYYANALAHL